ncbi:MAG: PPOX class F420-dependent oxidoreductase [Nakamurella sp.]
MTTAPSAEFAALAGESFVSLTTFRRSGDPVATPVWLAREGADLLVYTPADSGKVKRLRNDPRVTLQPCTRRGAVAEGAPTFAARATIVMDQNEVARYKTLFATKYGLQFRVVMVIERIVARTHRSRAVLRLSAG